MAQTVFELMAKIGVDLSDFESSLSSAENSVTKIGNGLKSGFSAIAKAAGVAFAAAGAAATKFVSDSVKVGQEFDKSMSQVYATMGDKAESMIEYNGEVMKSSEALRDYAQEMGRTTAFSATQAAEALNYMALAGYDAETSMKMLPNVLNLAAAGTMELATASDMVTDVQTAFGMTIERTTQMVDEMAKASSTGNTSVQQLGEAFLVVGGLAQDLNGGMVQLADGTKAEVDGIQELEIALTAMANAGVKGSEAGTHMRNMLMKLSGPTSEGTAALEEMGVKVFDAEGKMRSLSDIFSDLAENMKGVSQEENLQTIMDLFNARDIASAKALLNSVTGEYVKFGEEVYTVDDAFAKFGKDIYDVNKGFEYVSTSWDNIGESILNAEGAAKAMSETQLDNLAGDITMMKSAFEGVQIAVSDKVTPTLRAFVQKGTELIGQIADSIKSGGFNDALESAKEKAVKMKDTAVGAFNKIKEKVLEVKKRISDALEKIQDTLQPIKDKFAELKQSYDDGGGALGLFEKAVDGVATAIENLLEFFAQVIESATDFVAWIDSDRDSANAFKTVVGAIVGILTAYTSVMIALKVATLAQAAATKVVAVAQTAFNAVMSANPIAIVVIAIGALIGALVALYKNNEKFRNFCDEFFKMWQDGWQQIKKFFEDFTEAWAIGWEQIKKFWSDFTELWKSGSETITKWFEDIAQFCKDGWEIGKEFIDGLVSGIKSGWAELENFGGKIYDFLHPNQGDSMIDESEVFQNPYEIPAYANGGIVTKPTLAMIGESGAEAVVPLTKESSVSGLLGGMQISFGDIYVSGDKDAGKEVVEQIDKALRELQIRQQRGFGGTAWQI